MIVPCAVILGSKRQRKDGSEDSHSRSRHSHRKKKKSARRASESGDDSPHGTPYAHVHIYM